MAPHFPCFCYLQDGPGDDFPHVLPHRRPNATYDDYIPPGMGSPQGAYYIPAESLSAKDSHKLRSGHHKRHRRKKETKYADEGLSYTPESYTKQDSGYTEPYTSREKPHHPKSRHKTRHKSRPEDKAKMQSRNYNTRLEEIPHPVYTEIQMGIMRPSRPQRSAQPNRLSQFVSSSEARFKKFRGFVGDYVYRR